MKKLTILLFFMASIKTSAQSGLKTQSVSVFKDGNAFYVKSGIIKTPENRLRLEGESIPQARSGTLWFYSPSQAIASIISHSDTNKTKTDVKVKNISELLQANKGKKAIFETTNLKENKYEGTIEEVEADVVHIKTIDGRFITFNILTIQRVEFLEKPSTTIKTTDNQKVINRLDVNFQDKKVEQELEMMYLQQGLSWLPFYYLEILNDKKARLTLRSEVINNAENLENTTINFVVGVPNFKFASSLAGIIDFNNKIARVESYDAAASYQNYAPAPMMMSAKMGDASESFNNEIEGQSVEDLYFYPLKNFTLSKGSKAHYQLFNEEIAYEHIYECKLVNQNDFSQNYQNQMNGANPNKVFHSLKIKNESKNPFTTAPVTIIQKTNGQTQPLAQDMINFTPKKGESNIKITASPDVQVSQIESVKNRDENGKTLFGQQYFKATIEAKVTIKNYKDKAINFELSRNFSGTLGKSDVPWKIIQQTVPVYTPNTENQIAWNLSLKAGEEKVITYTYDVYGHN